MASEIHVGDIGTSFRCTVRDQDNVVVPLAQFDILQILFLKPDRTILTVTPTLYTDGTDGVMEYVTAAATDLDQSGIWKIQGVATITSGASQKSNVGTFRVYPNI